MRPPAPSRPLATTLPSSAPRAVAGAALAAALLASACAPTYTTHGFSPQIEELSQIEAGADTRGSVLRKLGRPSSLAAFDENVWFYIASRKERFAFYAPVVVERTVVVVRFDDSGLVESVDRYGLEDGEIVNLATPTTPTYGRELTFLQQLFGNLGNVDAEQMVRPGG